MSANYKNKYIFKNLPFFPLTKGFYLHDHIWFFSQISVIFVGDSILVILCLFWAGLGRFIPLTGGKSRSLAWLLLWLTSHTFPPSSPNSRRSCQLCTPRELSVSGHILPKPDTSTKPLKLVYLKINPKICMNLAYYFI